MIHGPWLALNIFSHWLKTVSYYVHFFSSLSQSAFTDTSPSPIHIHSNTCDKSPRKFSCFTSSFNHFPCHTWPYSSGGVLGFSILPRDISTCSLQQAGMKPATFWSVDDRAAPEPRPPTYWYLMYQQPCLNNLCQEQHFGPSRAFIICFWALFNSLLARNKVPTKFLSAVFLSPSHPLISLSFPLPRKAWICFLWIYSSFSFLVFVRFIRL